MLISLKRISIWLYRRGSCKASMGLLAVKKMNDNPYAPPAQVNTLQPLVAYENAEPIRKDHLNTESHLQAVGWIYILAGAIAAVTIVRLFGKSLSELIPEAIGIAIALYGLIFLGISIRGFKRWTRIAVAVLVGCSVLALSPVCIIINSLVLVLMYRKKSSAIFDPQYQTILAATPNLKSSTSLYVWMFLALAALVGMGWLLVMAFQALKKMGAIG